MNDGKEEFELTEQELNKIFFSSGPDKFIPPDVKKVEKKKKNNVVKPVVKDEIVKQETLEEIKKPQGRPKKWTKEKIAELKLLQRQQYELKKKQKDDLLDVAKLAMTTPLSEYERIKLLRKTFDRKKEIEDELVQQKSDDRKILNRKENISLWNKPKCSRHKYKISHIEGNNIVASCGICSEQKTFAISDWQRYIQTSRRLYNE